MPAQYHLLTQYFKNGVRLCAAYNMVIPIYSKQAKKFVATSICSGPAVGESLRRAPSSCQGHLVIGTRGYAKGGGRVRGEE
jgi:hypothetical protein